MNKPKNYIEISTEFNSTERIIKIYENDKLIEEYISIATDMTDNGIIEYGILNEDYNKLNDSELIDTIDSFIIEEDEE